MDAGRFLEFIYFSLFIISVNFPNQLVTDMSKLVLGASINLMPLSIFR